MRRRRSGGMCAMRWPSGNLPPPFSEPLPASLSGPFRCPSASVQAPFPEGPEPLTSSENGRDLATSITNAVMVCFVACTDAARRRGACVSPAGGGWRSAVRWPSDCSRARPGPHSPHRPRMTTSTARPSSARFPTVTRSIRPRPHKRATTPGSAGRTRASGTRSRLHTTCG